MVLDGARLVVANPKIGSGFLLDVAGILKHRSVRIYHKARTKKAQRQSEHLVTTQESERSGLQYWAGWLDDLRQVSWWLHRWEAPPSSTHNQRETDVTQKGKKEASIITYSLHASSTFCKRQICPVTFLFLVLGAQCHLLFAGVKRRRNNLSGSLTWYLGEAVKVRQKHTHKQL